MCREPNITVKYPPFIILPLPPKPTPKAPTAEYARIYKYITDPSPENAKAADVREFYRQMFKDQFLYEANAENADGYVRGRMVIELKGKHDDWLSGFYQALHYAKKGLGFAHVTVLADNFIGLWRVNKIPDFAKKLATNTLPLLAPSAAGVENAGKSKSKADKTAILESADFLYNEQRSDKIDLAKGPYVNSHVYLQKLRYLDEERVPVTLNTFLQVIGALEQFFPTALDAVHAFYDIVNYWDITSTVAVEPADPDHMRVVGKKGSFMSEPVRIAREHQPLFKRFVEQHYIFTNEGSGITADDYFARFDEVMARIVPEYVKQHGIFFTDLRLARFALWYTDTYFDAGLTDNYVVLDPAGGSGNLVSSWRKHIQHKIVAELQPDLLRIIDRRFRADEEEAMRGFTIVPRVDQNRGLNFLDQSANAYYQQLVNALGPEGRALDKPFAFLLNPPYKNTDEKQEVRDANEATYTIDPGILAMTGKDGGKERAVAFLAQITLLAQRQVTDNIGFKPVLMVFTPTSWLVPKKAFVEFRANFDQHWHYESGFITTSSEFFKLPGKWPLAFTIWKWRGGTEPHTGSSNTIVVRDLTSLQKKDLDQVLVMPEELVEGLLRGFVEAASEVNLGVERLDIRNLLPELVYENRSGRQTRYDFSRKKRPDEVGKIVSGFPLADTDNHFGLGRKCGEADGAFVGFMDNLTPVRVKQDTLGRMSQQPDRVWFQLRPGFIDVNLTKIHNGAPDKYGYCAYNLESARACFTWFAITKAFVGTYPRWANQLDLWVPDFINAPELENEFYRLCYAFGLAENRCVVTRFEADNPVVGAPAVLVDNPLSPGNPSSFWATVLAPEFVGCSPDTDDATRLVAAVRAVYGYWSTDVCGGQTLVDIGLKDEAYFRFFTAPDFLTPRAGLVQIRTYAARNTGATWYPELQSRLTKLADLRESIKERIYNILVKELTYFE